MNKSVLVIDTPVSCFHCPLTYDSYSEHDLCICTDLIVDSFCEDNTKPDWCPLSPLPNPIGLKQYVDNGMVNMYGVMYAQGYNEFREEILKGGENV